jgi:4-amino-4-deoxy-L-arabinose transferase-like glycosyltransferase
VTALISASGVVGVYLAGRISERGSPRAPQVALAGALLYAVASELVMHSRYAVTDACLVGLTAWTLAFAAAYIATRHLVWGAASIVSAGVTFAFKAPGLLTAVIPVVALAGFPPRGGSRVRTGAYRLLLLAALPVVVGSYVALNPHVIDRSQDAINAVVGRMRQMRDGGASPYYIRTPGLPHLMSALWAIASGFLHRSPPVALLLSLVAVAGIVIGLRRRRPVILVALLHASAVLLVFALPNRVLHIRNYLPVIPCLCLGFGIGVVALVEAAGARSTRWRAPTTAAAVLALALVLVVWPLSDAISAERMHEDPRAAAIGWVSRNVGQGSVADVGLTSTVCGKGALGDPKAGVLRLLEHPNLHFLAKDLDECPAPQAGPAYIVDASHQDPRKADPADPSGPVWLFLDCPGYDRVASFEPNPFEHDVTMTPNWWGRLNVIVLRRRESP